MQTVILILDALLIAYLMESTWIRKGDDDWIQASILTLILAIAIQSLLVMLIWIIRLPIVFGNILIFNSILTVLVLIPILRRQKKIFHRK